MDDRKAPIITEQLLNQSIERVWKAITNSDEMVQWFFDDIPAFSPEEGFETKFIVALDNRTFTHLWKITEVEALKKIVYDWSYKEYSGKGIVIFELEEKENDTLLRLTNTGLDSVPNDIPEFTRDACIGGWKYFINGRLKTYLDLVSD